MLILDRYEDEAVVLTVAGITIRVVVTSIRKRHKDATPRVKLGIDAPRSVNIVREELLTKPSEFRHLPEDTKETRDGE